MNFVACPTCTIAGVPSRLHRRPATGPGRQGAAAIRCARQIGGGTRVPNEVVGLEAGLVVGEALGFERDRRFDKCRRDEASAAALEALRDAAVAQHEVAAPTVERALLRRGFPGLLAACDPMRAYRLALPSVSNAVSVSCCIASPAQGSMVTHRSDQSELPWDVGIVVPGTHPRTTLTQQGCPAHSINNEWVVSSRPARPIRSPQVRSPAPSTACPGPTYVTRIRKL